MGKEGGRSSFTLSSRLLSSGCFAMHLSVGQVALWIQKVVNLEILLLQLKGKTLVFTSLPLFNIVNLYAMLEVV